MPGLFVPLDVNYYEDDKIIKVGTSAELLYVRGLAFVKRSRTDGHIAVNQLSLISQRLVRPRALVERLVGAGLWEIDAGGWYIVSWLKRNPAAADIHQVKSTAGALGNHKRWHASPDGVPNVGCHFCQAEGLV